ncbi:aldo/keto reductase [Treponema sp. OttesenSCG-928-L16]|nr:aldo/keto reductase [Treponema sp. OttesenSCG-928-L16]
MLYREYGRSGKEVSLLGFGGMRFKNIDNHDECVRIMVKAAEGGINYFDTAPGYFQTRSESVYGLAFKEFRKRKLPYYSATKTFKSTEDDIRREIDEQLKRLDVPVIDFYHVWSIKTLEEWQARKKDGVVNALRKLKSEGLIRHICVSSHLTQEEIADFLREDVFEGVLFGYSAYNYRTREKAFDAIRERGLGAAVMNPLGGGLIPQHPELSAFLKRNEAESPVERALCFLWDHKDISTTLVGFSTEAELDESLAAMEKYSPRSDAELAAVKTANTASMEGICTGCSYCRLCPQKIPVPKYMDVYNQYLLKKDPSLMEGRLRFHWGISPEDPVDCIECGQCEAACTQHLDIIQRLKYISDKGRQHASTPR